MEAYFLPTDKLAEWTAHLSKFGKIYRYEAMEQGARLEMPAAENYGNYPFPAVRAAEPAKFLFMKARRKVSEYFNPKWQKIDVMDEPRVVIGLKGCDLAAIKTWDNVFRDDPDFKDPFYIEARENTLLVGADCTDICETCCCNLLGNKPYPNDGEYDLSMSPVDGGFAIFVGSDKGKRALAGLGLTSVPPDIKSIEARRAMLVEKLEEQNAKFRTNAPYRELVEKHPDSKAWLKNGSTCVSCAACTYVCPTCFCFQLYDKPSKSGNFERFIALDSCQYQRFSFMAGGLNPRGRLEDKFMHRYNHKFFHYHWRYDIYACTGCGRCIENCMGKIDLRKTLKDIEGA